ncbi:lysozyme inhibitor LprI family protein [Cupriavidus sp. M-11]|uniref:lysozyme inhibitor LprI family protein n=1 Tax=Cupriavidus sp. M-11 TaxID=3233038 RepID=UPI003F92DE65
MLDTNFRAVRLISNSHISCLRIFDANQAIVNKTVINSQFRLERMSALEFLRRAIIIPLVLLLFLTGLFTPPAKSASIPDELIGKWEVVEVHVNTNYGGAINYGWDAPMLMWRIFDFRVNWIAGNAPEIYRICENPKARIIPITVDNLLKASLGGYSADSDASPVLDYQLGLPAGKVVDVTGITCTREPWEAGVGFEDPAFPSVPRGAWIFFIDGKKIALRWYDQTILILTKIVPGTAPSPSFSCFHARPSAEKAICRSHELAGLDKSIARAYSLYLAEGKQIPFDTTENVRRHRSWLHERNACGGNGACLAKTMKNQLGWLSSLLN